MGSRGRGQYIGLAKKFVLVFPKDDAEKLEHNFLTNPKIQYMDFTKHSQSENPFHVI